MDNLNVALISLASLSVILYFILVTLRRLYYDPIAHFPGPKLAALTTWYEVYYDIILKGQFTFHIQQLHRKYGPIIRISPNEIHIQDSDFYEELYARSGQRDLYEWMSGRYDNPTSLLTTTKHDLHRLRRAALNPMFSRKQINEKLVPLVLNKMDILCSRLAQNQLDGRITTINHAFCAFAEDIITQFAFGKCYNHLDLPEFDGLFHDGMMAVAKLGPTMTQFPWISPLMKTLPESWVLKIEPLFGQVFQIQRDILNATKEVVEGKNQDYKQLDHLTVFPTLLNSNLPPQEKSMNRLHDEAQLIVAAGSETTSWALTVASFHIINTPSIFHKLRSELENAIPDPSTSADLITLEQLPYLHACTQEAVRLSYGVTTRLPRILPNDTLQYGKYTIPAGTPISMTIPDVHHDEAIFPDSHTFKPERWLGNPRASNGSPLDRYLVAFGKGGRSCLGINLAQAELHIGLAKVFRRFTFELYETDISDVVLAEDWFLPSPKADSKGVRVRIIRDEVNVK